MRDAAMEVADWLRRLGLSEYEAAFAAHGVSADILTSLDADDLKEIGVTAVGHRRKLLDGIAALRGAGAVAAPAKSNTTAAESGERRQVSVLFADLAGFTRLSTEVDAEALYAIRAAFTREADEIVREHGGTTERHIGDCVMAAFGAPIAYGNDAERAMRAALAIQGAMPRLSRELGRRLDAHIGIASGEVVANGLDGDAHGFTITGETVNLASRLTGLARGGDVVVSDSLRADLGALIACVAIEPSPLKGFDDPVRAWRVTSLHEERREPRRAFVGRRRELRQLESVAEASLESGRGQTVLIRGEAGIGKTRLLEQFQRVATALGFACHGGLVLDFGIGRRGDPIKAIVQSLFAAADGDRLEALNRARAQLSISAEDDLQLAALFDLFDLPQPAALRALYDAIDNPTRARNLRALATRLAAAAGAAQPRLLSIEDIHWADDDMLARVAALSEAADAGPLLIALTTRLDGDPTVRGWRPGGALLTIDATPLHFDEATALARDLIDADAAYAARCIERAAGNPLFLEQLLRNAREEREAAVPTSVQSLIQARVDRLTPADKQAAQAAAIFGQRFSLTALRHLIGQSAYEPHALIAHFLVRPSGGEFHFEHALIRDAIYATLLKSRRRDLHRAAAAWFRDSDLSLWAEHLDRADDDEAPRAYLAAARDEALHFRFGRARTLVERGVALASDEADRFELVCYRADLLNDFGDMQDARRGYETALGAARDDRERCRAWLGLAAVKRVTDDLDGALADVANAEEAADRLGLAVESARARILRGNLLFPRGDFAGCMREHRLGLALAQRAESAELEAAALGGLGDAEYMLGRMASAGSSFRRCVAISAERGLVRVEVANRPMAAFTSWFAGGARAARDEAMAAIEAAARIGHLRGETIARHAAYLFCVGCADFDEALAHIERALSLAIQLGSRRFEAEALAFRGDVHRLAGRRDLAKSDLTQAVAICRETGMSYIGPAALGLHALAADNPTERRASLAEGDALLATNMISHNHFLFRRDAIEACLEDAEWSEAERHAEALLHVARDEPVAWSSYYAARGCALAACGRGRRTPELRAELMRIEAESGRIGLNIGASAIARALAAFQIAS